jgi:hypothetical protein
MIGTEKNKIPFQWCGSGGTFTAGICIQIPDLYEPFFCDLLIPVRCPAYIFPFENKGDPDIGSTAFTCSNISGIKKGVAERVDTQAGGIHSVFCGIEEIILLKEIVFSSALSHFSFFILFILFFIIVFLIRYIDFSQKATIIISVKFFSVTKEYSERKEK